jgi:hypothetical protein
MFQTIDMDREQQSQPGTGSAENTGRSREEQLNPNTNLTQQQREDISDQPGLGRDRLGDLREMGQLSGRDDLAGGDNDGMIDQSTGEETER